LCLLHTIEKKYGSHSHVCLCFDLLYFHISCWSKYGFVIFQTSYKFYIYLINNIISPWSNIHFSYMTLQLSLDVFLMMIVQRCLYLVFWSALQICVVSSGKKMSDVCRHTKVWLLCVTITMSTISIRFYFYIIM